MRHDANVPGRVLMLGTDPQMRGGIAAVVASLRDGGLFERAGVQYVATHVDGKGFAKLSSFVRAWPQVIRALSNGRVALVHAHVSSNASFWRKASLLWLARRFGVPTIFHLHSGAFDTFAEQGSIVSRWCIRRTLEASSTVIVLSRQWADWVRRFAPAARVRIIGNPVRIPTVVRERRNLAAAPTTGKVLYLGLICDAKGSFDLLQAWAEFRRRVPGWRLVVGGNGEVDRFLEEAARIGVRDDIDYLGWVTGADKEEALSSADVFVLPSYKEGMPVSVLEAMAYGAAVITTPVGGVPDMMRPQEHGLWVHPGDTIALAASLERLATSPELRKTVSAAARSHVVQNFALETTVDRICALYQDTGGTTKR